MKKARDYQDEGKQTILRELREKGKSDQLMVMATGMGKTYVGSNISTEFHKTLWLTHKEELIDQSALSLLGESMGYQYHNAINELGGYIPFLDGIKSGKHFGLIPSHEAAEIRKEVGVIKAERFDKNSRIAVASIQTMANRLQHFETDEFDLIIADEAHLAMSKNWTKVLNHFRPELRLGLTATPFRLDGANLCSMFGEITYDRDLKYGIDNGWLVEIDAIRVKTEISLDKVGRRGGEFKSEDLQAIINTRARNQFIVSKYLEFAKGMQTLVFAVDVQHCMDLCQAFNDAGVKATFVVGDENLCPNRRERFAQFKSGEAQVLVNVDIATTGFDHDMVECEIMARPTMSLTLYIQMIGRGTRTETGVINGLETAAERIAAIKASRKKQLLILDITDNTSKHNLVNAHNLDKDKKPDDMVFTTKEKIEGIKVARLRKLKHKQINDQRVDLLKLPKLTIYKTGKNLEPATEKQLAWLKKEGHEVEDTYWTKYDATMVISQLPCAEWQLQKLAKMGYDTTKGCTLGQFGKIMSDYADKPKPVNSLGKQLIKLPFAGLE